MPSWYPTSDSIQVILQYGGVLGVLIVLYKRQSSTRVCIGNNVIYVTQEHEWSNYCPWGTPYVTDTELDVTPSRTTCWVQLKSHEFIQLCVFSNFIVLQLGKKSLMGNIQYRTLKQSWGELCLFVSYYPVHIIYFLLILVVGYDMFN